MIQDIFPKKLHNEYRPMEKASDDSFIMVTEGFSILCRTGEELCFPRFCEIPPDTGLVYLFSIDDEKYFLPRDLDASSLQGYSFLDVRKIRESSQGSQHRKFAALTAKHLADWYRDNAFCGRCGRAMQHSEKERAMICTCGYHSYPRIMPAVIVGVINKDSLLLTRYRNGYRHNALIAGFTEIGETLEETVSREVMEEAGVRVKNIRYYKSQPWGMANDILAGFYCDLDGDETISLDSDELSSAKWVPREEIELQPDNFSLTNEMMMRFKNGESC